MFSLRAVSSSHFKSLSPRNRSGFLVTDAVVGLMIIAIVTIALVSSVQHEHSAELRLADSRSALHLAEHALLNLQHGQPLPGTTGNTHLAIHATNDGTAPAGFIWAKVDASVRGHHRSLIGIVPAHSIPGPEVK